MATHNAQNGPIVSDGSPTAEPTGLPQNGRRFAGLSYILSELSLTFNRVFVIIGVIAIGATALAYWAAYTDRHHIAAGAMAVVGLAMLAWTVVTIRMLWVTIASVIKWRANRRNAPGVTEPTDNVPG